MGGGILNYIFRDIEFLHCYFGFLAIQMYEKDFL